MNTSFPSAASDFASLLAGGKQPNTNSQLKGILAGLGRAKPAPTESASTGKPDFETMLDAPAESVNSRSSADNSRCTVSVKSTAASASPIAGAKRSILATELNAVVTTTLQIKGIVAGACNAVPSMIIDGTIEDDAEGDASTAQGETQSDPQRTDSEAIDETLVPNSSDTALGGEIGITCPTKDKNQTQGPVGPRQVKLLPDCGQSRQGRGWNPALVQHTGTKTKIMEVGTPSIPAKPARPTIVAATPTTNSLSDAILGDNASLVLPLLTPEILQAMALDAIGQRFQNQKNCPSAVSTDAAVPELNELEVTVATEMNHEFPAATLNSALPSIAQDGGVITNLDAVSTLPELDDAFASASAIGEVDNSQNSAEVSNETDRYEEPTLAAPEVRREVIETVAAMLAPFLMTMPVIQPEFFPAAPGAESDNSTAENGGALQSSSITIKIGSQLPFTIETSSLPAFGDEPKDSAAEIPPADLPGDEIAVSNDATVQFPSSSSLMTEENQSLDFRIQLGGLIDAAWQQSDRTNIELPEPLVEVPVRKEAQAEITSARQSAVAEMLPAEASGERAAEAALTVQANSPREADVPAGSVKVTIEMPGLASVTAQITGSNSAKNFSDKNSRSRFGRAEKTAGDFRPVGIQGMRANMDAEKTFLNAGTQPLKDKAGKDGTAVAISDDTMAASFTSRRVTVDQLEFPPRINAREVLPSLSGSQDIAAQSDAPVATTPAPVLAHRAVETILNVVEAQRESSANASSVNLHFKFGGDDLAVRVQMRGGEVLTQFLTDSAELRSALSNEWQTMAGQGSAAGLRLNDPLIMPASAGGSAGFGSMAQGQNQARQDAQHQQEQAAMVMPEFHALRRATAVMPAATVATPRVSITPATSRHLTATA